MSATDTRRSFFDCAIHRRLTGLEFKLHSPQIEEVMKVVSLGRTAKERKGTEWGVGAGYYVLDMGTSGIPAAFPGFSAGRFDMWGSRELLLTPRLPSLNLSMLLAVGLGEEVVVRIPTVMSESQLKVFTDAFESAIRQFYIDFLKESVKNIRIYTEEFQS